MKPLHLAATLLAFIECATAAAPTRPLAPIAENLEPTRSVIYKTVAGRDLSLHLFEPYGHQATDHRPAWVSIHGGGWTGGDARVKYPFAHHFSELGINDCFSADPSDPDARIDDMLAQAEILIAAFRGAAPEAQLGICLTTPPNAREEGFQAGYKQIGASIYAWLKARTDLPPKKWRRDAQCF